MNEHLVAVKIGDSSRENSVLSHMVGCLCNIVEGSIKIECDEFCGRVSLRSLGCGKVEREHRIENISHEVASTFLKFFVQIINNLLNGSVDLRKLISDK